MIAPRGNGLVRAMMAIALIALAPGLALAQTSDADTAAGRRTLAILASFGYAGSYVPGRWTPVKVTIDTGEKDLDGFLTVRYPIDSMNLVEQSVAVSGLARRLIEVTLDLRIPNNVPLISFSLVDRANGRRTSVAYTHDGSDDEAVLIASNPLPNALFALIVGERDGVRARLGGVFDPDRSPFMRAYIGPNELPRTATGYDSVGAVVLTGEAADAADERALAALRSWVLAGGRLVLVITRPGGGWRAALPTGPPGDVVSLGAQGARPPPESAVAWVDALRQMKLDQAEEELERYRETVGFEADPANPDPEAPDPSKTPPASAVASITSRSITLTDVGDALGWRTMLPVDDDAAAPALVAQGPMGFGWVTVIGFDPPRLLSPGTRTNYAETAWFELLRESLADHPAMYDQHREWFWAVSRQNAPPGVVTSGKVISARTSTLDEVVSGEFDPTWAMVAIGAVLLVLVGLLGPGDLVLLKRLRLRHMSWASALVWIGVACVFTSAAPHVLRSGTTAMKRVTSLDVLDYSTLDASGDQAGRRLARGAGALAWHSSYTGVLATSPMTIKIEQDRAAEQRWTPITAIDDRYSHWQTPDGRDVARLVQRGPGLAARAGERDPWTGAAPSDMGSITLAGAPARIWTLRTFADTGRTPEPPVRLRLEPAPGAGVRVVARVAPDTDFDGRAYLAFGKRTARLTLARDETIAGEWSTWVSEPVASFDRRINRGVNALAVNRGDPISPGFWRFWTAERVDGAAQRTGTIYKLLGEESAAAVYLELTAQTPDLRVEGAREQSQTIRVRVVAPLDSDMRERLASLPAAPAASVEDDG